LAVHVSGTPTHRQVTQLVHRCEVLALQHLRAKQYAGTIHTSLLGLPLEDLAIDCIADLFRQVPGEGYIQFRAYFLSFSIESVSEEMLLSLFRRLVYAKVNENLARSYASNDPEFAKIIRNIHLTVRSLKIFDEYERLGEACLMPVGCDSLLERTSIERDVLENRVMENCSQPSNVPQALSAIAKFLREQEDCCRVVPFMSIAFIVRSMFACYSVREVVEEGAENSLYRNDIQAIVDRCWKRTVGRMKERYVDKKKTDEADFKAYSAVVQKHLRARFVEGNSFELSLFDSLKKELGCLDKDEYRGRHRAILEYVYSIAQEETISELHKSFGIRQQ
jgi:hypothetical protein